MMVMIPHIASWALSGVLLTSLCTAKTVTYDFNVTWVTANPDGLMERKVIGINNQWPLPIIEVDKGDQLITHGAATFLGKLNVMDRVKFIKSFKEGIGRAKGFGFGLLQIVPLSIN